MCLLFVFCGAPSVFRFLIFSPLYILLTDLTSEKQRRTLYHQETEQMARTAEALMEDVSNMHITFVQATHIELGPCLR